MKKFFWEFDKRFGDNILVTDADNDMSITYGEAGQISETIARKIPQHKHLSFLFCRNDYTTLIYYLSLLKSGNAVLLLDKKLNDEIVRSLITIYKPEIILNPENSYTSGYTKISVNDVFSFFTADNPDGGYIYPETGVLLSTSGTTGSPKLVRLSYKNIQTNAESIKNYLGIQEQERAITSLPMSYSYGLSVINSHILSGASLVMTEKSFVFRDFWKIFNSHNCNSFAGVPYSYELLKKTNFQKMDLPSLKVMTQAGGRLSVELVKYFSELARTKGFRFFVMYGQTEATARISYVPAESLPAKAGSIGIPIPGGKIKIFSEGKEITQPGVQGELVYEGGNVMLGYATERKDLESGDLMSGILHTGDIAYRDGDSFFYITGRLKRFIKIFGLRLNLDDVEKMIEGHHKISNACSGTDDKLNILIDNADPAAAEEIRQSVSVYYKINKSIITVKHADKMPVTDSGKKDYKAISKFF